MCVCVVFFFIVRITLFSHSVFQLKKGPSLVNV